jgi:hypothetical protein
MQSMGCMLRCWPLVLLLLVVLLTLAVQVAVQLAVLLLTYRVSSGGQVWVVGGAPRLVHQHHCQGLLLVVLMLAVFV